MQREKVPDALIIQLTLQLVMLIAQPEVTFIGIGRTIKREMCMGRLGKQAHSLIFSGVPGIFASVIESAKLCTTKSFQLIFLGPARGPNGPVAKLKQGDQFRWSNLLPGMYGFSPGLLRLLASLLIILSTLSGHT